MADPVFAGALLYLSLMPAAAGGLDAHDGPQCRVPASLPTPSMVRPRDASEVRQIPVGGYTLALSWSPQYCAEKGSRGGTQCDGKAGRFGFVLHGLWPEGKNGRSWPQYCSAGSIVPHAVLAKQFCTQPSVQLMQHEWAKHGTCMARKPDDYFAKARGLYQRVRFPDMQVLSRAKGMTAGKLTDAFLAANPKLRKEAVRIRSGRSSMLSEVWLCLNTAFEYTACPAGKSGMRPSASLRIQGQYNQRR